MVDQIDIEANDKPPINRNIEKWQIVDAQDLEAKADLLIKFAGDWPEESEIAAQIALRAAAKINNAFGGNNANT